MIRPRNAEMLESAVRSALDALHMAERFPLSWDGDDEDAPLNIGPCAISISPCEVTLKTFCGEEKHPGWEVAVWGHAPATRWEPEDWDTRPLGSWVSPHTAAQEAVLQLARADIESALEAGAWEFDMGEELFAGCE
jgi:hypothetical protein